MGIALPNRCMESGVLLGGDQRRSQGLLEKCGEKIEVNVEKLEGKDGPSFWFKDRKPDPKSSPKKKPDEQSVTEDAADDTTTEEVIRVMSEVDPGEVETGQNVAVGESGIA